MKNAGADATKQDHARFFSRGRGVHVALDVLARFGIPVLLVVSLVAFSVARPESYATWDNFRSILEGQSVVALLALAVMIPLIVGEFDLSVAAVASLANILVIGFSEKQGWGAGTAILLTLMATSAIGLINGLIVVRLQVSAFVSTLGMATLLGGIGLLYTDNQDLLSAPAALTDLADHSWLGVPSPVVYMLVVAAVTYLVLARMPLGRRMYAVGGNRRAADLSGIRSARYVIGAFTAAGLLAGIAGVILGAQLGSASNNSGSTLLLQAFAGAFLGATTIRPGRFNVLGAIVSVYFLAATISGLQQMGAQAWVEPVFNGSALIVAVALSAWAFRLQRSRAQREQLALLAATADNES